MGGTITRITLIRHPLLIVKLFGVSVLVRGLFHQGTFLDLLTIK